MVAYRKYGAGQSPRRREDRRFLTGRGRYTGDIAFAREAHAVVVRSPHAHARLAGVETAEARAAPGVLAVLSGADALADGLGEVACIDPVANRDGSPPFMPTRPVLAHDKVRHVGDGVALVVAETAAQARDAAERVCVDYEPLAAVADPVAALRGDAPLLWAGRPDNLCVDWAKGDAAAADAAFAAAAHVSRIDLVNNRVVASPMEPRGAVGQYDPGRGRYTLHVGGQSVHTLRKWLTEQVLRISINDLRVVTPDVGGGFGMKTVLYCEYALVLWAARRVGRPVRWMSDRTEAFLSDAHARDHVSHAELALDAEGRILALRASTVANMGAYLSTFAPAVPTEPGQLMLAGCYTVPCVHAEVRCVFTNTSPVDAYRGAGRPEASYLVERLVDQAAREMAIPAPELRRRNFIPCDAFPHTTVTGLTYDSGDYARNMDAALGQASWDGFEARRAEARARGRLRGLGLASYIEICGIGASELARITVEAGGEMRLSVGTQSNGQGHETAFAQILAAALGIEADRIQVRQGDTDAITYGRGTGGSRSLQMAGPAILMAAEKIIAKARRIAAHMLEAAEADVAFEDGKFRIPGTDRALGWDAVSARAFEPDLLPATIEPGLDEQGHYAQEAFTFPNGCHVCEVEVDPETGAWEIVRYVVVDDYGVVLNPLLVEGQVHGGLAQGIGQALIEQCAYDGAGQLLTGSFLDYAMPRAADLPSFATATNGVPSPSNPLGVKGAGEAGTVGAPAAAINALIDALGTGHLDMPATPARIWAALRR